MWSLLIFPGHASEDVLDLVETKAARAFVNEDYRSALEGFNQLALAHPEDLQVKRYQALCLEKLGEDAKAIDILVLLTFISPDPVSSHYYLGTIYYKLQQAKLAQEQFDEVVLLGVGSEYARLAERYLDAISEQQFESISAGAPKKWGVHASLGYNDDIDVDSSLTSKTPASSRLSTYFSARYYLLKNSDWTSLVSASIYQSDQQSESNTTYSRLRRWSSKISAQNQSILFGSPLISLMNFGYGRLELDGNKYSDDWFFYLSSKLKYHPDLLTGLYISRGKSRFPEIENTIVDTTDTQRYRTTIGVDQRIFLKNRKVELGLGMYLGEVSSVDRNHNRDTLGLKLFSRFSLPGEFKLNLTAEKQKDSYPDYDGIGNREATNRTISLALLRRIGKHATVELSYKTSEIDFSDLDGGRGRDTWGVRVSYVY